MDLRGLLFFPVRSTMRGKATIGPQITEVSNLPSPRKVKLEKPTSSVVIWNDWHNGIMNHEHH